MDFHFIRIISFDSDLILENKLNPFVPLSLIKSRIAKTKEEESSKEVSQDGSKMKSDSTKSDLQQMQSLRKILDKEKSAKEGKENDVSEATRALLSRDKKKSIDKGMVQKNPIVFSSNHFPAEFFNPKSCATSAAQR